MKKTFSSLLIVTSVLLLTACGGGGKPSAKSIAQKWCDLNAAVHKAPDGGPEYGKAKEAREKYENDMESKYGKDKEFMDQIEKEVENCEAASEGRK